MAVGAITLNSGHRMPIIGLGVWRMETQSIRDVILSAIKIGYRHFDCAADYQNESEVGEALAEAFQTGLVKREELFITTKLWNSDHGHVLEACKNSLKELQLEYLDLYLVHFPIATKHTGIGTTGSALAEDGVLDIDTTISLETTWHAMEDLVSEGLVRSIGISNYDIFLTRDCLAYSKINPAVNQIETHPYFQRDSLVKFCQKHGICATAHTPLGGAVANTEWFGSVSCLVDPVLQELARKYNKTVAQFILRWGIQRNTVVIPKSSKLERLKENFQVFDFAISDEDMDKVKAIDRSLPSPIVRTWSRFLCRRKRNPSPHLLQRWPVRSKPLASPPAARLLASNWRLRRLGNLHRPQEASRSPTVTALEPSLFGRFESIRRAPSF